MADDIFYASPTSPYLPDSSEVDIKRFFALDHSPSSASANSSPRSHIYHRSHPPLRHRRCLFATASLAPVPPVAKLPPPSARSPDDSKSCRKRGAYNCGKCGQPKRGHVCQGDSDTSPKSEVQQDLQAAPKRQPQPAAQFNSWPRFACDQKQIFSSAPCSPLPPLEVSYPISTASLTSSCSSNERHKLALQHGAAVSESAEASAVADASVYSDNRSPYGGVRCFGFSSSYELAPNGKEDQMLPLACLVHILSRLSAPSDLVAASNVCRRWRQSAEYVWAGIRQTSISIGTLNAESDFIPFMLRKCSSLQELTLNVTSELGDSLLKCISCITRYLSSFEVSLKPGGVSNITGEGLADLICQCKTLRSVKFEGCDHVAEVELSSSSLATLWLIGCHRLKYMFLNCPELSELCLDFLPPEHVSLSANIIENSDCLAAIMRNLGCTARGLTRLHVASPCLQDRVIHGLFSSGRLSRSLRMLSLTFGVGITDQSVAAIATNCEKLELLDLSGSSITDVALELICSSFSTSLARLLIALCPRISQDGLEMVVSKLPLLQVLDCGKVMVDKESQKVEVANSVDTRRIRHADSRDRPGKLHFQHQNLQKLSLWGCAGLEALTLDCPSLVDLNLTGCSKLEPARLQLLCPSLREAHVGKCAEDLLCEVQYQLELAHFNSKHVRRRQGDGSKRVQAPNVLGSSRTGHNFQSFKLVGIHQ
ncbi:hypothetical protein L7F22_033898 [Adiantum nelumboides]|nr:hypothetical protein [Adiantum nelumboides]